MITGTRLSGRALALALLLAIAGGRWAGLDAQTVPEIVERNLAARGGIERLRHEQTQRLVGHITFGDDPASTLLVEQKRPGMMRTEIGMQGQTIIQVTDGHAGWLVNPFGGSAEPKPLGPDELHNLAGGADFEGPLVDYAAKGNRLELVGRDTVDGAEAWKLRVTLGNGDVRYDYVDVATGLECKWTGTILNNGKPVGVESWFRDWRRVNGVMVSWRIDSDTPGTPYVQKIVFDSVSVDQPIEDQRFGKP